MEKMPFAESIMTVSDSCFSRDPLESSRKSKPVAASRQGLCATCNGAPGCSYLATQNGRPVLHCEEFDDTAPPVHGCCAAGPVGPPADRRSYLMGCSAPTAHTWMCAVFRNRKAESGIVRNTNRNTTSAAQGSHGTD